MSANTVLMKTELQALANQLTNALDKYKCLELIDQYIAALNQQAIATATDISSYADPAGASVTRRSIDAYASMVANLEDQIYRLLYGNVTFADFRVPITQNVVQLI